MRRDATLQLHHPAESARPSSPLRCVYMTDRQTRRLNFLGLDGKTNTSLDHNLLLPEDQRPPSQAF